MLKEGSDYLTNEYHPTAGRNIGPWSNKRARPAPPAYFARLSLPSTAAAAPHRLARGLTYSNGTIASVIIKSLNKILDRIANATQDLRNRLDGGPARFSSRTYALASVEGGGVESGCLCKARGTKAMRLGCAVDCAPDLGVGEFSHRVLLADWLEHQRPSCWSINPRLPSKFLSSRARMYRPPLSGTRISKRDGNVRSASRLKLLRSVGRAMFTEDKGPMFARPLNSSPTTPACLTRRRPIACKLHCYFTSRRIRSWLSRMSG